MEVKIEKIEKKRAEMRISQGLHSEQIVDYALFKREISTLKKLNDLEKEFPEIEKKVAYSYFLYLLSKRNYTKTLLRRKGKERLFSTHAIDHALQKLDAFLNDEAYLRALARDYASRGKGKRNILLLLKQKTDTESHRLQSWIDEECPDEKQEEKALAFLHKKFSNRSDKAKAYRFLISRGFSSEITMNSLHAWENSIVN